MSNLPDPEVVDGLFEDGGPALFLGAVEHGGDAVVVAGEVVEQDQVAPLQQLLQGRGISFWNRNSLGQAHVICSEYLWKHVHAKRWVSGCMNAVGKARQKW